MDRHDTGSSEQEEKGGERREALSELSHLVTVLERERDLLVAGDWERLDAVLEEKDRRSRRLGELMSSLPTEEFDISAGEEPTLRGLLTHLSELASVNLVLARESSLMVGQVLREIALEAEGGGTYGASGEVGATRPAPAMVSTRG